MKFFVLSSLLFFSFTNFSVAEVTPKEMAPNFKLNDLDGVERSLSDFKGKWVVLEWFNKDCPFVRKHYGSSNMQKLQKTYTSKGVIWLMINSSAKGKQGYEEAAEAKSTLKNLNSNPSYLLADKSGSVGKLYGAKTTPHMFIISPEQKVVYAGAIDDNSSPDPMVIEKSRNYVSEALDLAMANKAVTVASTKPYGCAVKY